MIDDIVIGNALGIQDQPVNADVTLYPNPARDHICVSLNQPEIFVTDMALMNETGTILKEYPFNHMSGEIFNITLPTLSSGIYYLVINSGTGRIVKKVAVVN